LLLRHILLRSELPHECDFFKDFMPYLNRFKTKGIMHEDLRMFILTCSCLEENAINRIYRHSRYKCKRHGGDKEPKQTS
jgi:hypothetical protein